MSAVPTAEGDHIGHTGLMMIAPTQGSLDHYQTIKTSTQTCNDPARAILVLHVLHVPRQSTSQRSTNIFSSHLQFIFDHHSQSIKQLNLTSMCCNEMQKGVTRNRKQCVLIRQLGDH